MEENTKIKLKDLIDFYKYNYIQNIWNNGLDILAKKYPVYGDDAFIFGGNPYTYRLYRLFIYSDIINDKKGFTITMSYKNDIGIIVLRRFFITKINNEFVISSKKFNDVLLRNAYQKVLSSDEIKEILETIDFTNLFNYFIEKNISNESLKFEYKIDDIFKEIIVDVKDYEVKISDGLHEKKYYMYLDNLYYLENYDENEIENLILMDYDFLENTTINFKELPKYVQDNIYKYKEMPKLEKTDLEQNKKLVKKIKNIFKRI